MADAVTKTTAGEAAVTTRATEAGDTPSRWLALAGSGGVRIATFRGFDADDRFLVGTGDVVDDALPAASTIALREQDIGCRVVLAFDGGDLRRPIVIGRLLTSAQPAGDVVRIDAERVLVQAGRELELRCGDASIVLTRAGKVLIKGSHVSSRSLGANRIKGAHVDIN